MTETAPKTVLLTGASSGMGKVIAETLARQGHTVFAAMRDMAGRNADNAAYLRGRTDGAPITPVEIDVTDNRSVEQGVGAVLDQAGGIDVLINCAGVMWTGTTEAFSIEQFQAVMETNLTGPFRMLKAVLPAMRSRASGLILTITSTCGRIIPPGFAMYSASKFGLEALAEGIGYEVSGLGIDSVIIEPGPFATNLMANQQVPARQDIVADYGDCGRFDTLLGQRTWPLVQASGVSVDPQDVADLVSSLIVMDPGTRPMRTTVGMDSGVADMNRAMATFQHDFLTSLDFGHLYRAS